MHQKVTLLLISNIKLNFVKFNDNVLAAYNEECNIKLYMIRSQKRIIYIYFIAHSHVTIAPMYTIGQI